MNATLARLTRLTHDPLAAGDGPLIDAFLAGDQDAFAVLVRRHATLVFATCRRILRHQQDAEDAFQATFLVLARRAGDVWPREAVGSWLFGVAHRVALKARAVRSRRAVREQPLEDVASAELPPPDFDLAEAVQRVVCRLPEVYRAAVVACDLEGLSRKEAAERLGWTEGTLSGRLARARELLARRFRHLGLTLPVGVATLCAVPESVSAASVQSTIDLATGTAGVSASAPVAALTEGVVRSMAIFKLKAMTAALFAACAIGFGALAAGPGTGRADGQQKQSQSQGPAAPVALNPADPPAKPLKEKRLAKPVTDADRLQGTWRVVALTEGEKTTPTNPKDPWVIEVSGTTLQMPYLEGGSGGGWKQRAYTFAVEETRTPREINLAPRLGPVGRGIYEFTLSSAMCASCHDHPFVEKGAKPPATEALAMCAPALKAYLAGRDPGGRLAVKARDVGVRLALSIDGKRPEKFGGAGVIVFELHRAGDPDGFDPRAKRIDLAEQELQILLRELEATAKNKVDPATLERLKARIDAIRKLLDAPKPQPDPLDARLDVRAAIAALEEARRNLAALENEVAVARAQAQQAANRVDRAFKNLEIAKDRVKAAEKAVAEATAKPQPEPVPAGAAAFTVHVRTLTAAEKVTRVKATGNETVLDALVHAADVSIKSDEVSVWIVRDKALLPVDLTAITKSGETKTNYVLKAGDQLFVQVKSGK